jgi:hypothetical protein
MKLVTLWAVTSKNLPLGDWSIAIFCFSEESAIREFVYASEDFFKLGCNFTTAQAKIAFKKHAKKQGWVVKKYEVREVK